MSIGEKLVTGALLLLTSGFCLSFLPPELVDSVQYVNEVVEDIQEEAKEIPLWARIIGFFLTIGSMAFYKVAKGIQRLKNTNNTQNNEERTSTSGRLD